MHLVISSDCPLCHGGEESIIHVLRDCPKASNVWNRVRRCNIVLNVNFDERDNILLVGDRVATDFCRVVATCVGTRLRGSSGHDLIHRGGVNRGRVVLKPTSMFNVVLNVNFVKQDDILLVGDRVALDFCRAVATRVGTRLRGNALVDDIREMLAREWAMIVRKILKDMNKVVDALAVLIHDGLTGVLLFNSPPDFVVHLVIRDNVDDDKVGVVG
ncbi:hypothetical protein V6N11_040610 [Hibiscus sabdariffa]|uniref:Reverse transcriptase zinc-binding domain-containing protein n=1 Tax=Hibiscus sabdariffa TaxID=183260 RepID=A0ABR2RHZ9_9ROSI